ncbi:MAG TPA: FCD domain-containing protein [Candidatus Brachybacterium intestinipullorum]|uniref:FCD domain-containing protein n=1 Tax=Candidatus Brachybacterium intestinipullorum TaxID=2838512 RepID=A0A9D2Q2T7_9MICO|nr:FCD domain-containing protein [Candidatus Brachybacterium intestinipullorum]
MPSEQGPGTRTRTPSAAAASPTAGLGDTAWRYLTAPTEADGPALSRETLVGRARQAVLDLIDDEGLDAGDALPSAGALAERFAVSKAVVREALSALDALGIVEISNGRAARVRPFDSSLVRFSLSRTIRTSPGDGFSALMDLRAPLEVRAAALAARRIRESGGAACGTTREDATRDDSTVPDGTAADGPMGPGCDAATAAAARELREHLERMGEALGDSEAYPRLDMHLHAAIARLADSPALHGVLDAVSSPLFRAMRELRVTREARGLVGAEHAEHVRIVEAILAGDERAASAAMTAHMDAVEAFGRPPATPS